jgi:hypothetical protein
VIGMPSHQFSSFREFWPYYVAMHSRASTRWIHLTGTLVGAVVTGAGAATGRWYLLPGLPVLGYGAAWPSHWRIERNNPAAFGHPLWSFAADLKMIAKMLGGRDGELSEIARNWLAEHPLDRSAGSLSLGRKPRVSPRTPVAAASEEANGLPGDGANEAACSS